jgi:hypothetical protein
MNLPLIHDAIDLLRLRVGRLEQYQYPLGQLMGVFTALGIMSAAAAHADGASGDPLALTLFFSLYTLMETSLYATFMRWWLRRAGCRIEFPLIGLVAAASLIKLLDPLVSWLPDDVAQGLSLVMGAVALYIVVKALALTTGASVLRVLGGTLLFSPVAIILMVNMVTVAASMGVEVFPPEVMQAATLKAGESAP